MSRQIDLSKKLTDDEREYLETRGLQAQLDENARLLMGGGAPENTPDESEDEPYKGVTIPDLKKLIEERNANREDDKKIVAPAASATRPEFVQALVADDETNKTEG